MDEALKYQEIQTTGDTYITELCNKYTGFMWVKTIYLFHHLMDIYEKITKKYLNENHERFNKELDTNMPNEKYF